MKCDLSAGSFCVLWRGLKLSTEIGIYPLAVIAETSKCVISSLKYLCMEMCKTLEPP